uniref:Fe2OG dioxygenase domain-containing protein n=1 Tax=Bionectria ochroleuca TaxID=29856 RepID=A0A8H7K6Z2_BIOOC
MLDVKDADTDDQLRALQHCVESNYKEFLFACGGTVPISSEHQEYPGPMSKGTASCPESASSKSSSPTSGAHPLVTLRWDPKDVSTPASQSKLILPIEETTAGNLKHLLAEMKPATFGRGGEDVYDESYRKASKLEPQNFSTNFCPYSTGIIGAISQLLLPNPKFADQRIIKAELYKLNVYTGPSGHFRSHVDTPRSRSQFGSLVVCLPVKHEGGALEVRHDDEVMKFDWGSTSEQPELQWAAFYSDCEHEVFPVQSGHRITLTYNLYATFNSIQRSFNPLNNAQTPLDRDIEALVRDPTFLPDGGYVGFHTTHTYPHNDSEGCLEDTLKGLDMVIWRGFQRLGCGVCLRPVLQPTPYIDVELPFMLGRTFELKTMDGEVESIDEWDAIVRYDWGLEHLSVEDITWLNKPTLQTKKAAFAYTVYGNQASSCLAYTVCAIIVSVPKINEGKRANLETTFDVDVVVEEEDWEKRSPWD